MDKQIDLISRADAIRVASGYCHPSNVAKELAKLPSVTPQEPKTGHWILVERNFDDNDNNRYICSNCYHSDEHSNSTVVDYCWHCGAKMVEPQESEDTCELI